MPLPPKSSRRLFLRSSAVAAGSTAITARALLGQQTTESNTNSAVVVDHAPSNIARSDRGAVATVHPLASQAAVDALEKGGNAIDAALAASLTLSVVDGHNSGIGGGCVALVRNGKDGTIDAFDGRETAPKLATQDQFLNNGKPNTKLTQVGSKAVATPGLLAALESMNQRFGKLDYSESFENAIRIAEEGFIVDEYYAARLLSSAKQLSQFPASRALFFKENGQPFKTGERLRQIDLASTLKAIRDNGNEWFYNGPLTSSIGNWMQQNGGLLRADDFRDYRVVRRRPVLCDYRNYSVAGFPPPSSGGIHVAQMLKMLTRFPVADIFATNTADGLHLLLEAMRVVMADRTRWLGDSDFFDVPQGLLNEEYLIERSKLINLEKVSDNVNPGLPNSEHSWPSGMAESPLREKHTTHLTTADDEGNVVALTQTINTTFGSKVVVPGTGVILNNEMDDFSIAADTPNAYGLVGSEANLIAPGKRPLSSMSPTIAIEKDSQAVFSCGAAGGPRILTTALQMLVRHIDLKQPLKEVISAPRIHHQWVPNVCSAETTFDNDILDQLRQKGHLVKTSTYVSTAQAIAIENGIITAASDPRVPSSAMGN